MVSAGSTGISRSQASEDFFYLFYHTVDGIRLHRSTKGPGPGQKRIFLTALLVHSRALPESLSYGDSEPFGSRGLRGGEFSLGVFSFSARLGVRWSCDPRTITGPLDPPGIEDGVAGTKPARYIDE